MGWDADAIFDGQPFKYVKGVEARQAFRRAREQAVAEGDGCDQGLELGHLDMTSSVRALAEACSETNRSAVWDVERTRQMYEVAQWPDISAMSEYERISFASAKAFLRACAENGYGVQFDP